MSPPNEDELRLFPLSDGEWEEVYKMANEQTVSGPVFQGVCQLPDEVMPPVELLELWVVLVENIENISRKMNRAVGELLSFFWEKGLNAVVLKGQGTAQFYEHPLQRSCGDIDLFFNEKEELNKALDEIRIEVITPVKMPDGAYTFRWKGIDVEIHRQMFDIHNPFKRRNIDKLHKKQKNTGHLPSPMSHLLILNSHILKHLMGHGVGLRQLADMARAYHRLKGKYSEEEYNKLCASLGLSTWTKEMNGILVHTLGLPVTDLPEQSYSDRYKSEITEKILQGGNFGKYAGSRSEENASSMVRKWKTAVSIFHSYKLSRKLAPQEAIFMALNLISGQL